MRRAIAILPLLALSLLLLPTAPASAATSTTFNGIGLVDYTRKPDFKVGDWVRYRMSSRSELGVVEQYDVVILVAGERDLWGDKGFWIETWREEPGRPPEVIASLISYDIFKDSTATQRLQIYTRQVISLLGDDGAPRLDINKPSASILKARREVRNPVRWTRDTVGVDTVVTPAGDFRSTKVLLKQGTGSTQAIGDSTIYQELREDRVSHYHLDIPITHLVKEDIELVASRKAWMIGRSGDATELTTRDRGTGSARLIAYGHGGLEPVFVPKRYQSTIAEQKAAAARAKAATRKPAPTTKR